MSMGRLLLILLVLAGGIWLARTQSLFGPPADKADAVAPADRARAAARVSDTRNAQAEAASKSLEAPAGSADTVTENMTGEQVRALLGPPDTVETEATESGSGREKWIYRNAGKTVVFENGAVIRIE